MDYIGFSNEEEAVWYRNNNGGWLFVATDRSEFIWFSTKFTMTPILKHRATQGLAGIVTCARSIDEAFAQIAA
jgi:hypothetical protein